MKNIVRNIIVLGCVGSSAFAAPFLAIGDNAELFVTGTAGVRYDDNILLAPDNQAIDDTIVQFVPGLVLDFGKDSAVKGTFTAQETLNAYLDNSQFNDQLGSVSFVSKYDNGNLKLNADASFAQLDQNTYAANGTTIRRDVTTADIGGELSISDKTSIGTGFNYTEVQYKQPGAVSEKDYGVPVNVYYGITPKVDLSAGVSYRRSDLNNGTSFDDYYYNVGARGEFTPKLKGTFSVGYNQRNASVGQDDDGLGLQAGLTYLYTDKTLFTLNASNDFSAATTGASQKNFAVTLGGQTDIAVDWKLNASATYRRVEYQTTPSRTDDYVEGTVGATYVINSNFSVNGSYLFRGNKSDQAGAGFSDNVVSLSISARY
jgi:hypothetical protein